MFAVQPSRRAVLFIHGFSGDSITTWAEFHQLLPEQLESRGADPYFYGYDGLRAEMNASAGIFRNFLTRLFEHTAQLVNTNLPTLMQRDAAFTYDQFVIVVHSLGAVIVRRALVDATDAGADWVNKVRLVLFAPAHMGASIAALAKEAFGNFKWLRFFSAGLRFTSPLIDELESNSDELKSLRIDPERLLANGANPHLTACKVVFAEYGYPLKAGHVLLSVR